MRQTLDHLEPMCDVQEMSMTTQNKDYEDCKTQRAPAHVFRSLLSFMLCFVLFLWILVFTLSLVSDASYIQQDGFVRQLHFTTHTQHQVQSSFLLDIVD